MACNCRKCRRGFIHDWDTVPQYQRTRFFWLVGGVVGFAVLDLCLLIF